MRERRNSLICKSPVKPASFSNNILNISLLLSVFNQLLHFFLLWLKNEKKKLSCSSSALVYQKAWISLRIQDDVQLLQPICHSLRSRWSDREKMSLTCYIQILQNDSFIEKEKQIWPQKWQPLVEGGAGFHQSVYTEVCLLKWIISSRWCWCSICKNFVFIDQTSLVGSTSAVILIVSN